MARRSDIKPSKLGIFLKEWRETRGIGGQAIANRAGLPASAITRIENGEHTNPSPRTLAAIAAALDIPVLDLLIEAGVVPRGELPNLKTYLKAKYDLTEGAAEEVEGFLTQIGITCRPEPSDPTKSPNKRPASPKRSSRGEERNTISST
ncbi:helix-turn-helix domain-containing protein [Nocardia mexicana]|uniref:Transcriptional regulator with XRE-family HTH domain n=1 Tax=Nocardia mexicana TaxID=279262 RepID=A0A370HAR5_9NOCA|nr:helix-turn-helix transcriptional regulator [Nocardia mexicana]RDI54023.1 transcriptional regulator with XRE-family HTH domain [Nocardia mexicana]